MAEKRIRQQVSAAIKQDLVRLVTDGGRKCLEVAAEHQVSVASLYA